MAIVVAGTRVVLPRGLARVVPPRIASAAIMLAPDVQGSTGAQIGSLTVGQASYTVPEGALYVDADNGSDTADGTESAPLATVSAAVSKVTSGGTIVLRAGSHLVGTDTQAGYGTQGQIVTTSCTIQNYPGEAVWLDGSKVVTGTWTPDSSTGTTLYSAAYDRLFDRSPTFTTGAADDGGGAATGDYFLDPDHPEACWPDMILVDGTKLTQVASKSDLKTGTFFIEGADTGNGYWFQGSKVWLYDNPAGHEVRYAANTRCFWLRGQGITVRGVGIRRFAPSMPNQGCVYFSSSGNGCGLENVFIQDISCSAIMLDSQPNVTISKCTGRAIGFNFLSSNKANNIKVTQCDIQGCNDRLFNLNGPSDAAIKVSKVMNGFLVDQCIISNNHCMGIWTDMTVDTPVVSRSWIENNDRFGVQYEANSYGVVIDCVITGSGYRGIYVRDSDQARIYNCTFVDNEDAGTQTGGQIDVDQSQRRADDPSNSYLLDPDAPSGYYDDPAHQFQINHFEICNNVLVRTRTYGNGMIFVTNDRDPADRTITDMTPTLDGNVYYWASRPTYPFVWAEGYNANPHITDSPAETYTFLGQDQHSTLIATNPVDANYKITDTSLHANAVALPSDLAELCGQTTGVKHAGAFIVDGTS